MAAQIALLAGVFVWLLVSAGGLFALARSGDDEEDSVYKYEVSDD